jgi:hypothetical protein
MKRYSPILFIWIFCLIFSSMLGLMSYINKDYSESLAWCSTFLFLGNLILYHFNATKNESKRDSDILDE